MLAMTLVFGVAGAALAQAGEELGEDASAPRFAIAAPEPGEERSAQGQDPGDEAFIDGVVGGFLDAHATAGYIVSLVRDGELILAKGYGFADAEAVSPATGDASRFFIGSISKTFLWTAVMIAVERGEIDLDTDVNDYLTRYKAPVGERPLTMNDLMAHRVGFEDSFAIFLPETGDLSLPEALAVSEPRSAFARSGPTAYSNWATALAVLVLEDATKRSYRDILFDDILLPIGMTSTTLDGSGPVAERIPVARSYKATAKGLVDAGQLDLGVFSPIGGMTSTAADMGRWMLLHLGRGEVDGVRLLSEKTYSILRNRAFEDRLSGPDMAHGFQDATYRTTAVYGHGGSINSFLSNMMLAPELGVGVFISQNAEDVADPVRSIHRILFDRELARRSDGPLFERVLSRGVEDAARRGVPAVAKKKDTAGAGSDGDDAAMSGALKSDAARNAEEVAGTYLSNRRPFTGFEKFLGLQSVTKVIADGERIHRAEAPDKGHAPFRRLAPDLYENRLGERLVFVRDGKGAVARFVDPSGTATHERVVGLADPQALNAGLGAAFLLSMTTWLGLWRRIGRPDFASATGRALSAFALIAPAALGVLVAGVVQIQLGMGDASYAEVFAKYPPDGAATMLAGGTATAVVGALLLLTIVPAWRSSGWSIWRKGHHTLLALAFAAAGFLLWRWGLAFSSAMTG